MASMSDNPDKESTKWFLITIIGAILYISAAFGFVTLREIGPTEDQVKASDEAPAHGAPGHEAHGEEGSHD